MKKLNPSRTQIIVAAITTIGVIVAAFLGAFNSIFSIFQAPEKNDPKCEIKADDVSIEKTVIYTDESIAVSINTENPTGKLLLYSWEAVSGKMNPSSRSASNQSTYTAPSNPVNDTISVQIFLEGCDPIRKSRQIGVVSKQSTVNTQVNGGETLSPNVSSQPTVNTQVNGDETPSPNITSTPNIAATLPEYSNIPLLVSEERYSTTGYGMFTLSNAEEVKNAKDLMSVIPAIDKEVLDRKYTHFEFNIESQADDYQITLEEIQVDTQIEEVPPVINTYLDIYGLGAGVIKYYECEIDFKDENVKNKIFTAKPIEDQKFDYVYLKPKEKEYIDLNIKISKPGIYTITPKALFSYNGKKYLHTFESRQFIVPDGYRLIAQDNHISNGIINNETKTFKFDNIDSTPVPVLFSLDDGLLAIIKETIYIWDGNNIEKIGYGLNPKWSKDGSKVIFKGDYGDNPDYYQFDILSKKETQIQDNPLNYVVNKEEISSKLSLVLDQGGGYEDIEGFNGFGRYYLVQAKTIQLDFNYTTIIDIEEGRRIEFKDEKNCIPIRISPLNLDLLYECSYEDKSDKYAMVIKEAGFGDKIKIEQEMQEIEVVSWSNDGKYIIFGNYNLVKIYSIDGAQVAELEVGPHIAIYNTSLKP